MGGLGRTMPLRPAVGYAGLSWIAAIGWFLRCSEGGSLLVRRPWLVVVLLLVNGLTAFNLTRVFVWCSQAPQVKTCRAPEVKWHYP